MQGPKKERRAVLSLRISMRLRHALEREAERLHTTPSTLAASILERAFYGADVDHFTARAGELLAEVETLVAQVRQLLPDTSASSSQQSPKPQP